MNQVDLIEKIAEYTRPVGEIPLFSIFIMLRQIYDHGHGRFYLERSGILEVFYDEGNPPSFKIISNAEVEYQLFRYIAEWLDLEWKNLPLAKAIPVKSRKGHYFCRVLKTNPFKIPVKKLRRFKHVKR